MILQKYYAVKDRIQDQRGAVSPVRNQLETLTSTMPQAIPFFFYMSYPRAHSQHLVIMRQWAHKIQNNILTYQICLLISQGFFSHMHTRHSSPKTMRVSIKALLYQRTHANQDTWALHTLHRERKASRLDTLPPAQIAQEQTYSLLCIPVSVRQTKWTMRPQSMGNAAIL